MLLRLLAGLRALRRTAVRRAIESQNDSRLNESSAGDTHPAPATHPAPHLESGTGTDQHDAACRETGQIRADDGEKERSANKVMCHLISSRPDET